MQGISADGAKLSGAVLDDVRDAAVRFGAPVAGLRRRVDRATRLCAAVRPGDWRDLSGRNVAVTRPRLERGTYGLTYRTGFRPPLERCGLDFTISLGVAGGEPHVKSLRSPRERGFLLIAQSGALSRGCVAPALRGFQQMVRFYLAPLGTGTPIEVRCSTN